MKSVFVMALALCFGIVLESRAQPATDPKDELAELVVPLDKPSAFLESARKSLDEALAGIHPEPGAPPRSEITKSGLFVLWGDLFKTGGCFAVAELSHWSSEEIDGGLALAEWIDHGWTTRALWKIATIWRPESWQEGGDDYLPVKPATEPFHLRDFSGDGVPELVVAGQVFKYFQTDYLLRFEPKAHRLKLLAQAMGTPEPAGDYVRLYFKSGRLAIYEEWQFLKWKGDELIPVASWHDEVAYGTNDPTFSEGERADPRGKSEVIRVVYGKGQEYVADAYELARDGEPFGRMQVTWKDEKDFASGNSDEIEKAWLFEKITGLPRRLYPAREGAAPTQRLEDLATVTIEGSAEAAKLFSLKSR